MAKPKKPNKLRYERSEWIFDWKRSTSSLLNSWSAIVLVAVVFVFLLLTLRVKLVAPAALDAPQASVIHLPAEGWSQALEMEARAKGPFPSRFEPADWQGVDETRAVIERALRPQLAAHQPKLMPFPDPGLQPPSLARRGEPVLPDHSLSSGGQSPSQELQRVPVLLPLDGIRSDEMPKELPPWNPPVTEILAARPWKFLVELEPSGRVRECVSLAGGQELSPKELSQWLRGVVFGAKPVDKGSRWIAISIEFQNRVKK